MLTEEGRAWVRDEIGTTQPPTDEDLDEVHDRITTVAGTAYVVLSRRLADLRAAPAQFTIVGDYAQNTAANIASLEEQVERLRLLHEEELTGLSGSIVRLLPPTRRLPRVAAHPRA